MSSNRVKRLLRKIENLRGNKKQRISKSDDEMSKGRTSNVWKLKSLGDTPINNIYNSSSRSPPAELFRKDLISAMKLPDSDPLTPDEYWLISDQWKQEWERGVQVPVNPDALPEPVVRTIRKKDKAADFKMPKKLMRLSVDDDFNNEIHQMSNSVGLVEKVCRYDLDDCDLHWLNSANSRRKEMGLPLIEADAMETIIETLETKCYENMQEAIHSEAVLGIEYDENVICDVCRSPDSEDGNEMVFCDSCDICVHQACYGITSIPAGSWLCRTCSLAIKPSCILCPNKGGAMKCTRTGNQWAHVSCALWIPEVSIGCVETMEPITKITHIPPSRWALICCLCRERAGACIQCSVKSCKTAYHVTCGFQNGLEMKAVVEDENDEDGVKLRSYCPKHSNRKGCAYSDSEGEDDGTMSRKQSEDKANTRVKKLQQIEALFFKYVKVPEVAKIVQSTAEIVEFVYHYWKLKRRSAFNVPLLIPSSGDNDALSREQEDGLYARMKMFVHLRQDLERVRNLCYMVSRREKLSRSWTRMREEIFHQQVSVMFDESLQLTADEKRSVVHACHGRNIYDRLYAFDENCCRMADNTLDKLTSEGSAKLPTDANGLVKAQRRKLNPSEKLPNPYAKTYFNGLHARLRRKSGNVSDVGEGKNEIARTLPKVDGLCSGKSLDAAAVDVVHGARDFEASAVYVNNVPGEGNESITASRSVERVESPRPNGLQHERGLQSVARDLLQVIEEEEESMRSLESCEAVDYESETSSQVVDARYERNGDSFPGDSSSRVESWEASKDDDGGKYVSAKENIETLESRTNRSDRKNDCGDDEEMVSSVRHRHRKSKQRFRNLQSPPKDSANCKTGSSHSSTTNNNDVPPVRDKHRQESAKIHETIFAISRKGSLAGYRIPKVPKVSRNEAEAAAATTKLQPEEPGELLVAAAPQSPLLQQQHQHVETKPPPPPASAVPVPPQIQLQSHQNHGPSWREQSCPPPLNNPSVCSGGGPLFPQQSPPPAAAASGPKWNCGSRPLPLLPTPPIPPRLPPLHNDRPVTRRDKMCYNNNSASSSSTVAAHHHHHHHQQPPPPSSSQMNGQESGRIVIKLRKDPNFPESQCWRRDCDEVIDTGVYDFRCEANESPPRNLRLKLDTRFSRHHGRDRSLHQHHHHRHPADQRTYNSNSGSGSSSNSRRGDNKYLMRSRNSLLESGYGSNIS